SPNYSNYSLSQSILPSNIVPIQHHEPTLAFLPVVRTISDQVFISSLDRIRSQSLLRLVLVDSYPCWRLGKTSVLAALAEDHARSIPAGNIRAGHPRGSSRLPTSSRVQPSHVSPDPAGGESDPCRH